MGERGAGMGGRRLCCQNDDDDDKVEGWRGGMHSDGVSVKRLVEIK